MDDIVKQAMAKWPNVPDCYGWLALDARGHWRMRDEHAQQHDLPGDKIVHTALLAFIARNYTHDARGCWFFQNGPQRVYLNLEATPYIARGEPDGSLLLHTGAKLEGIEQVFLCPSGQFIVQQGDIVAQLDDRDLVQVMAALEIDGRIATDDAVLAWLESGAGRLGWRNGTQVLPVQRIDHHQLAERFGFNPAPAPA
ncbi:MAG: DUF2946 family protein [Pseudomonadota bacterium]